MEKSYFGAMLTLKEIVQFRLEELDLGPVEAAVAGGLERTFIRDILEDKKKSVRSDKIAGLAHSLKLDAAALSRNEIVRVSDKATDPEVQLRSALLAYGVDREDLGRAVSAVKVFVDDPDERSSQDLAHDQPEPSSRRRASEPS